MFLIRAKAGDELAAPLDTKSELALADYIQHLAVRGVVRRSSLSVTNINFQTYRTSAALDSYTANGEHGQSVVRDAVVKVLMQPSLRASHCEQSQSLVAA